MSRNVRDGTTQPCVTTSPKLFRALLQWTRDVIHALRAPVFGPPTFQPDS